MRVQGMSFMSIGLAHLIGDYILQNDWMANEKTKRWTPAVIHGVMYTVPFAFITQAWLALLVIGGTHIIIDRYRLAKGLIWAINQTCPKDYRYTWAEAKDNAGYSASKPIWMSVWLMFIIDNTCHLVINSAAIAWLG